MKIKDTSEKVIRIPVIAPVIIVITIAIIATGFLGTQVIKKAARYTETNASTTEDGNFEYTELDDGTIKISKYVGTDIEVVIPDTIEGKNVTSIGHEAFKNCSSLTSVGIPSGVTEIGNNVFYGCRSLSSIEIPEEVTTIGSFAFAYCTSLRKISIPSNITDIWYCMFYNCTSLSEIDIPPTITSIGYAAFENCSSLSSMEIPEGVKNIGTGAFSQCTRLSEINIPSTVTYIGDSVFFQCESLAEINVATSNQKYMSENGVLFNREKTSLICYPASKEGEEYSIPEQVITIEYSAFSWCRNLNSVEIQNGVTEIKNKAFYWCTNLDSIEIPETVTSIGKEAFFVCSSLRNIEIPEGVTSIGDFALYGCRSLAEINIPSSVDSIGNATFRECTNLIKIDVETTNETYIAENGVLFNKDKTEIICYPAKKEGEKYYIPEGVMRIGNSAFYFCKSLTEINIPSTVTSIGEYALYTCSSLTNIEIPEGVTSIEEWAFAFCTSLRKVNIPSSVRTIESKAFYGAKIIKNVETEGAIIQEIEIPDTVKRTKQEGDILYTEQEFTLTNCTINEENIKLNVNVKTASEEKVNLKVNGGKLDGMIVEVIVLPGTIIYSEINFAINEVIATLYIAEGETIINNNGENAYTFTKNGEFTFEYTDIEGNTQTVKAVVDWIYKMSSEKYNIENLYIKKIQPETTRNTFKSNLQADEIEINVYNNKQELLTDSEIVVTGMQLKVSLGDNTKTYILVVTGDTNKDGKSDFKDLTQINSHRLNKNILEDEYLLAADVNEDGVADFKDLVKVNKYRLHKITEL